MPVKVFRHDDGSFSAPFCDLGKAMIRAGLMNNVFVSIADVQGCNRDGCSCLNAKDAIRKADPEETAAFWNALNNQPAIR